MISSPVLCRNFLRARCVAFSSAFNNLSSDAKPHLPDYNTSVNVHEHKLKRPQRKTNKQRLWDGMAGLEKRTVGSLIPDTLKQMDEDEDFKITAKALEELGQKQLTKEERKKRQRALDKLGVPNFLAFWRAEKAKLGLADQENRLKKTEVGILQLNIALYCNQACNHCHVEASPRRKGEMMDKETADRCLHLLANSPSVHTLDLTGGAPELCPEFRYLVTQARKMRSDLKIIDRCNLTVLLEPGFEDMVEFLVENKVDIIASLPCYTTKNVNLQRGSGVFDRSIRALNMLNGAGYGKEGTGLEMDLVYNPLGGYLPPPQAELELKYKEELWDNFGIEFNKLFCITNMPIKRFVDFLSRRGELEDYIELLIRNYNVYTMDNLMCRDVLSVNWKGELFDCDFNQQLDISLPGVKRKHPEKGKAPTIWDIESADALKSNVIAVDNHCFGCTSGMGSSCQGVVA